MVPRICLFVLVALWPGAVLADSDGYYCVGRGFVGYEMSLSQSFGQHVLHIVKVGHETGIVRLPPVELPDFQVHGMVCREDVVELQGWSEVFSVRLGAGGRPTVSRLVRGFKPSDAPPPNNLGMLARAVMSDIPSDGPAGEFQLVIAQASRRLASGVEYYTVAQVVQRRVAATYLGPVVASETLYAGVRLETGDQHGTVVQQGVAPDAGRRDREPARVNAGRSASQKQRFIYHLKGMPWPRCQVAPKTIRGS